MNFILNFNLFASFDVWNTRIKFWNPKLDSDCNNFSKGFEGKYVFDQEKEELAWWCFIKLASWYFKKCSSGIVTDMQMWYYFKFPLHKSRSSLLDLYWVNKLWKSFMGCVWRCIYKLNFEKNALMNFEEHFQYSIGCFSPPKVG